MNIFDLLEKYSSGEFEKRKLEKKFFTYFRDLLKREFKIIFKWKNFLELLEFLRKFDDNNELEWFKRLINYIYNILNSNIIFSKINRDEFLRYWLKDKNKFFGNISKTHLEIVQNLQIDNKFVKILEEIWLNKWEVLLVKLF